MSAPGRGAGEGFQLPALIRHIPERPPPIWRAAVLVMATTGAASVLGLMLGPWVSPAIQLGPYVPAIMIATLWGGRAAGAASVAASVIAAWIFFILPESPHPGASPLVITAALIFIVGAVTFFACDALRVALTQLRAREAELLERQSELTVLVRELDHRVKNIFTLVSALSRQTAKSSDSLEDYSERFGDRLLALARAQTAMIERRGAPMPLERLAAVTLEPFAREHDDDGGLLLRPGPEVELDEQLAGLLGLVLHELATNAVKYGALSRPGGRVICTWSANDAEAIITWVESGGPPVAKPARRGFGAELIGRHLSRRGKAALTYDAAGVRFTFTFRIGG